MAKRSTVKLTQSAISELVRQANQLAVFRSRNTLCEDSYCGHNTWSSHTTHTRTNT